jgi:peptide-methionine (S)-S-oxide reductase
MTEEKNKTELATLGAGCFWCIEAVYKELTGVIDVKPGYTGGHIKNPAYREVCNGTTGHAEVAQLTFDPSQVTFSEILEVFFSVHDPTTLNRQGADVGTQYRSEIFCHSEQQMEIAQVALSAAEESGTWPSPIVTAVSMIGDFYPAEEYHNDYYENNPDQGYCRFVVKPKLDKFRAKFKDKLKA